MIRNRRRNRNLFALVEPNADDEKMDDMITLNVAALMRLTNRPAA